jgi:hypothetical protein
MKGLLREHYVINGVPENELSLAYLNTSGPDCNFRFAQKRIRLTDAVDNWK